MRCYTWLEGEAGAVITDILWHTRTSGPQVIRSTDGEEVVLVRRADHAALLARLGEPLLEVRPFRGATQDEVDEHLERLCGMPQSI